MFRFYYNTITLIAIALLFLVTNAIAISELGNGEVLFDSNAGIEYDSNVLANSDEESDLIGSITAGIAFEQLERSVTNVIARAQVEAVRYLDLKEFDTENLFFEFQFSYPNNLEKNAYYELGINWSEITRGRREVGQIVESRMLGVFGTSQVYLNEKSGVRFSGNLRMESFTNSTFSDSDDLSFAADYLYRYSSKLDFVTGYRYRDLKNSSTGEAISTSQNSHTFGIGLEGKLRPKVEGNMAFGVQYFDSRGSAGLVNEAQPYYEIELEWQANSRASVSLSGSSDFQSSPDGSINNRRDISIQFNQILRFQAFGSIGLTYAHEDFSGLRSRKDDSITLDGRYLRNLDENKNFVLAAEYEISESDDAFFSYDRLRLALNFVISF